MPDDNASSSDDSSSPLSDTDGWFLGLGVSRDNLKPSDNGTGNGDDNGSPVAVAGVGPGNWGKGPGQDYRGPGGAKEPGPDNPVRIPGDGDTAPDTMPRNRVDIDPDADPSAPTNPSPTLRSPQYDPTPQSPPSQPSPPPDAPTPGPGTPPGDDIPPTLRSPGNPAPVADAGPGAAGVVITGDVVLTGSIVLVGLVEIAAAIYKIIMGWEIGDLAQSYTPSVDAAKAGFKAAMTGGSAPGDQFGKLGYDQGSRNYQALFAKVKQDNPQAGDDAIKAAIAGKADDALNQVSGAIDQAVRGGMWDGYLASHSTVLSGDDARWAYVACFGDEPDSKNPDAHWKKYLNAHPYLSWTSPK